MQKKKKKKKERTKRKRAVGFEEEIVSTVSQNIR